ncbi:MAG: hypothetical protein P8I11_02170 [Bacteroidia bacterium]|nr:hypothetical protein [Bacteroidia bacterium]
MNLYFLFITAFIFSISQNYTKLKWRYDIEIVSESDNSNYIVKVSTYSKKPALDLELAKKSAIHGVIFKGVNNHPPLANNLSIEKSKYEFFREFFGPNRIFSKFVSEITKESIGIDKIIKTKKGYKISSILMINHVQLRKYLENQGIIKPLNYGL